MRSGAYTEASAIRLRPSRCAAARKASDVLLAGTSSASVRASVCVLATATPSMKLQLVQAQLTTRGGVVNFAAVRTSRSGSLSSRTAVWTFSRSTTRRAQGT
ncbi:hypothetical protein A4R44_00835 [Amycolatopsis sp. M39]|nr:hypothetical protein A4R44_00835 [Amycolatopsis sp. M39]